MAQSKAPLDPSGAFVMSLFDCVLQGLGRLEAELLGSCNLDRRARRRIACLRSGIAFTLSIGARRCFITGTYGIGGLAV
jgi:hypothetical protein